ncbi:FAD/NAD(P)-binding domain-containing protein [Coprinopsis marcescibilis]|uniref:FAD/NAD(P)-binding domain-containing protein n=1 Tax=Coprinopsis marcescibilis TaxID=230819 RepID=A0A5C3LJ07_COPMA|nr:FAD/NAD(P)-binding domain-containing protein [Coprinopsis marcescibilis]
MAHIVVVGGGVAGANVVRGLSGQLHPTKHKLTLITSRPQFVNLLWSLRVMADPNAPLENLFMPYDNLFGHFPGEIKVASVKSIEETKGARTGGIIILSTGEPIQYDVLVLATGSVWEGLVNYPTDPEAYYAHVASWRKKIKEAENIVIAGGGPVGIELCGEIKDVYPDKSVTIVQGDRLLLNDVYPDKFRTQVVQRVRQRGVDIIFDDAIKGAPPAESGYTSIKTREGRELPCDLLITCRGGGANTPYMKFLRPSPLTDRGYVKVQPTFEVLYHPGIFALGDIVDLPEVKQLAKIDSGHANVVVSNVMSFLNQEPMVRTYRGQIEIMAVSIGRERGISYLSMLWGITLGHWLTKTLKSRTLVIEKVRHTLGIESKLKLHI